MDRCPNCRARNDQDAPLCRRCGLELELLRRVERAAEQWLQQAIAAIAAEDPDRARYALQQARTLRQDDFTAWLTDFVSTRPPPSPQAHRPSSWSGWQTTFSPLLRGLKKKLPKINQS